MYNLESLKSSGSSYMAQQSKIHCMQPKIYIKPGSPFIEEEEKQTEKRRKKERRKEATTLEVGEIDVGEIDVGESALALAAVAEYNRTQL